MLICAAPVIAAWLAFFVFPPSKLMNYGDIIEARPLPDTALPLLDGRPFRLSELKGRWVMLQVDGAACAEACQAKLYQMRQVRTTQGREMERIERVWLIDDAAQLDTMVMRAFDGTRMLRAAGSPLLGQLPPAAGGGVRDHIYVIDPLGNLMMRFPKDADPSRIKKDIERLLKVSRIG
ncbi:MAG: cytochrome C oxidase subunit I [Betaproteobacteria bacterium]